jgi:hypothetical protein
MGRGSLPPPPTSIRAGIGGCEDSPGGNPLIAQSPERIDGFSARNPFEAYAKSGHPALWVHNTPARPQTRAFRKLAEAAPTPPEPPIGARLRAMRRAWEPGRLLCKHDLELFG